MKLLLGLLLCVVSTEILLLFMKWMSHFLAFSDAINDSLVAIGNSIFTMLLVIYVVVYKDIRLFSGRALVDVVIFLILLSLLAFAGVILYASVGFGIELLVLIETIGYYPSSGPDAPMEYGVSIWLLTCLVPIFVAFLIGAGIRRLFGARADRGSGRVRAAESDDSAFN
jgi:hypothetical protein